MLIRSSIASAWSRQRRSPAADPLLRLPYAVILVKSVHTA
jgi:hypothetical protein